MREAVADVWADLLPAINAASRRARRTLPVLHIQKVGGTTLGRNLKAAPHWIDLRLPRSDETEPCRCGSDDCPTGRIPVALTATSDEALAHMNLCVTVVHEDYFAATTARDALVDAAGVVTDPICVLVRPVRERLVSIFTDYWTQVADAERAVENRSALTWHQARTLGGYLQDSVHYRDPDGRIDGVAWYRAFAEHGSGAPFFLDEVFAGEPDWLEEETRTGRLRLIPTSAVDAFQDELLGTGVRARHRVSRGTHSGPIADAVTEAAPLIDELATRDARYDALVARLTDDPSFSAQASTSGRA